MLKIITVLGEIDAKRYKFKAESINYKGYFVPPQFNTTIQFNMESIFIFKQQSYTRNTECVKTRLKINNGQSHSFIRTNSPPRTRKSQNNSKVQNWRVIGVKKKRTNERRDMILTPISAARQNFAHAILAHAPLASARPAARSCEKLRITARSLRKLHCPARP